MHFETEVGLKMILHPDHHAALERQSIPSLTEDPIGLSKSVICVLSETPAMLYIVKRKGENSIEDQNSLL